MWVSFFQLVIARSTWLPAPGALSRSHGSLSKCLKKGEHWGVALAQPFPTGWTSFSFSLSKSHEAKGQVSTWQ